MTNESYRPVAEDQVTALLEKVRNDGARFGDVIGLVYDDLKRIGHQQRFRFDAPPTLQTTALVNEAFLKLQQAGEIRIENRNHLKRLAAVVMRQLIFDHARRGTAQKRGAGIRADTLEDHRVAGIEHDAGAVLEIERAFRRMQAVDPRMAEVAGARLFAGYTHEEIAELLDCSPRTVRRIFTRARAWLKLELEGYAGD